MPHCAVVGCNNTHRKTKGGSVKYHRFPGDSGTRNQWLQACGKSLNNCSTARICSRHFSEGSYERDVQHELLGLPTRCRLKRGSIPDQNLPNDFSRYNVESSGEIAILLAVGLIPADKTTIKIEDSVKLQKMQIMEDVQEICDGELSSSPHAENSTSEKHKIYKTENSAHLSNEDQNEKHEKDATAKNIIVVEKIDVDMQEEHSNHSVDWENNKKKVSVTEDDPLIERLKTEIQNEFEARDKILNEFLHIAECNSLDQVDAFSEQISLDIKTLNELAAEKEKEWNQLLHMKKLREELLVRIQRRRQILVMDKNDVSGLQSDGNVQQNLMKYKQGKMDILRELGVTNLDSMKQRNSLNFYKQKPMLDVQSIIADYRKRHPESVPRRGRRIRGNQGGWKSGSEDSETGSDVLIEKRKNSQSPIAHAWHRQGQNIKSYKDILIQFAQLSQSEKTELQTQLQISSNPQQTYSEVTVHPVTGTSSITSANSLLHGILTKTPLKHSIQNENQNQATTNGKNSFSPTLAKLLTGPETATSTANMFSGGLLDPGAMSEIFSGSKMKNGITITPVGDQFHTQTRKSVMEEESDDISDRLIIDEANESHGAQDDNRSEDGEEVPQCQGCQHKSAQFVCAGCGNQWYCSRDCQVAAWDDHSEFCSG